MNYLKLSAYTSLLVITFSMMVLVPVLAAGDTPQQMFLKKLGCEKALIVNGDDLGRTMQSNEGILKAFREGILTSASLMAPALKAKEAYALLKENPDLDVGVHLVLARDKAPNNLYGPLLPLDKVASLIDPNGHFFTSIDAVISNGNAKEILNELHAQVKDAIKNGVDITHMDCHMGFYHTYDPKTLKATLKIARKYDLPIRWAGSSQDGMLKKKGIVVTDYFTGLKMDTPHDTKQKKIIETIEQLKNGITELLLHPATGGLTGDAEPARQSDLAIALDPDIRKVIKDNNVCLIGYRELRDFQRELREQKKSGK